MDNVPAEPLQRTVDLDIQDILSPAVEVLFSVVLGADFELLPLHINAPDIAAELVTNHELRRGSRQPGIDEKQPQPGFPQRLGATVDERLRHP